MGKNEHPFVWYYNKNPHFAELMNGWLFHGREYLTPDHILDADRRILTRKKRNTYHERYRDLCKCINGMIFRLLIGVEHQGHVHYAMPVRVMDYDCSSYILQTDDIRIRHRENKDLKGDEFLSGFSREDRLFPVVTLVLYSGSRPWDGALGLHELLDFDQIPSELKEYIADYQIHVLDICHTSDNRLEEFPPDIRTMFLFIKYKDDPKILMKKLAEARNIDTDTYDAITDLVGEQRLKQFRPQKKGEKVSMCKAIDILIAEGEKRGEIRGVKLGEKRGKKRGIKRGVKLGFRQGVAQEQKNTLLERERAEKAEARVRELERMLNI